MVCNLLYTGAPTVDVAGKPRPGPPPPPTFPGRGIHPARCMDLGPNTRFEIRRCPSRLGNTWRWLVFKDRSLIKTGIVSARDRSDAEAAAKAAIERSSLRDSDEVARAYRDASIWPKALATRLSPR
jgi:hypothetical protein